MKDWIKTKLGWTINSSISNYMADTKVGILNG